jgi:hypothetical protein
MVTDWLVVTAVVVAVNAADVAVAGTVTDTGTVTAALLSDRLMSTPPAGAAPESVTVHALETPPRTVAGAHTTDESVTPDTVTVRGLVAEAPLYVAVITAA